MEKLKKLITAPDTAIKAALMSFIAFFIGSGALLYPATSAPLDPITMVLIGVLFLLFGIYYTRILFRIMDDNATDK